MSKYLAQSERFTPSFHKFAIVFGMILTPSTYTTATERNIARIFGENILQVIVGSSVQRQNWNYDLHNSYSDKNFTRFFSVCLKIIPQIEHDLFPTHYFKLSFINHQKLWKSINLKMCVNKIHEQGVHWVRKFV
jgi:hypothetical protein